MTWTEPPSGGPALRNDMRNETSDRFESTGRPGTPEAPSPEKGARRSGGRKQVRVPDVGQSCARAGADLPPLALETGARRAVPFGATPPDHSFVGLSLATAVAASVSGAEPWGSMSVR